MAKLRTRLLAIPGVTESPSMFKDDLAFWVNGKEIAHLESPTALDVRLTRAGIRATRAAWEPTGLVHRRATGSDWVTVDVGTRAGANLAVELVEHAAALHAPAGGEPAQPPPDGARLRSLRRFHVPADG